MGKRFKFWQKVVSLLLVTSMLGGMLSLPAFAQQGNLPAVWRATNDFVQYSVNTANARFSIKTDEGVPHREDENKKLLFEEYAPETSFTTFRIDGKDYVYGDNYGLLGMEGVFTEPPQVRGRTTRSTWVLGGLRITQELMLIDDEGNPNVGNVKVTYTIHNQSESSIDVGARVLLDTMLGANDASPVILAGDIEPVTKERRLRGG